LPPARSGVVGADGGPQRGGGQAMRYSPPARCAVAPVAFALLCLGEGVEPHMVPREDDVSQRSPSAGDSTGAWLEAAMAVEGAPRPSLQDLERRYIARVLQEARGNQRRASRVLGISRWSLSRRLRRYGLTPRTAA
jgi:DNA-binding NtrC family response regulator